MCIVTKVDTMYDTYHRYMVSIHDMYRRYLFVQNIKTSSSVDDGPPEPYFNMCTTLQDSGLVRNCAQSQFLVK